MMQHLLNFVQFVANLTTIIASGIAVYLFIFKGKAIKNIFKILLNYSSQITLQELRGRIDKLNGLDASINEDAVKVMYLLSEIVGQIRGSQKLKEYCADVLGKLEFFTENPKNELTEQKKRSIICELQERLRHIDLENIDELVGGRNE
jgi:hypothetical protein